MCSERGNGDATLYVMQNVKKRCVAALYVLCVVVDARPVWK